MLFFLDPKMTSKTYGDLELPFVPNRTFGLCQEGDDAGSFDFEWNDANRQVLIRGDRINPAFMKQTLDRPKYSPYHEMIPELSANPLFIDRSYTVYAEIKDQYFRADRNEGGDVVLVSLDPKNDK